ncbi:MAG: hypothetical protein QM736_20500 [Vicinamibacterales bacterium]
MDLARQKVLALPTGKPWEVARRDTQLEAITAACTFLQQEESAPLRALSTVRRKTVPLIVSGVSISVRPELLVHLNDAVVGAVKLYFSKTSPLSDERARYGGTILQMAVEMQKSGHTSDYRNCFIVDVFAKRLHPAPRTSRRRRQDVDAACTEIAALWST